MARLLCVAVLLVALSLCWAETAQQNYAFEPNNYKLKDSYGAGGYWSAAYESRDGYYSANGYGNNLKYPQWGSAWSLLKYDHLKPWPLYAYDKDLSPRAISNVIATAPHSQPRVTPRNTTDFVTAWGQFVDHDITYTPAGPIYWNIPVPKCDRYFDPHCTGHEYMKFQRSIVDPHGGEWAHPNVVTAWLDGSQIYGPNIYVQKALRSFVGGRLRTSHTMYHPEGEFPPRLDEISYQYRKWFSEVQNDAKVVPTEKLFACGDVRCNEQPLLLSLHVLFLREHNRVAGVLSHKFPYWDDETLFQKARSYVIAELQHITFYEFLFWLMGGRAFDIPYTGYNPHVSPDIDVVFSTAAFRYGHSEINEQVKKMIGGGYGSYARTYFSNLWETFFDNRFVTEDGIGPILQGMASHAQSSNDNQFADSVRNDLFRGNGPRKYDLMAADIQRSRDHGLPKYNEVRAAYGLPRVPSWDKFKGLNKFLEVDGVELIHLLKSVYPTPDDCDFFVCGLCEDWVQVPRERILTGLYDDYSHIGESFEAVIIKQFASIRDGDRLWYELPENYAKLYSLGLEDVNSRFLSEIIRDNTKGAYVQFDVFVNLGLDGLSRFQRPFGATPGSYLIRSP